MSAPRTALVTGAGSGIGAAIARAFAAAGMTVIVSDRDLRSATVVTGEIHANGGSARAVALDVTDSDAIADVMRSLGESGLDVLVNNAGIGPAQNTSELTWEDAHHVLAVNLEGAVRLTLAAAPLLRRSPTGRVLNVASVQGMRGTRDSLAYATSKGGMLNFTRSLACDLADDGVLVNALAPGFVNTPLAILADGRTEYETDWFESIYVEGGRVPLRRPAEPHEIASAAVYLCSTENTYVTGQILPVDGGLTATF